MGPYPPKKTESERQAERRERLANRPLCKCGHRHRGRCLLCPCTHVSTPKEEDESR